MGHNSGHLSASSSGRMKRADTTERTLRLVTPYNYQVGQGTHGSVQ